MFQNILLLFKIRLKLLQRNKFNKYFKSSSWFVLLLTNLFIFVLSYFLITNIFLLLIASGLILSITNTHNNQDKSWISSLTLYPSFNNLMNSVFNNLLSFGIFQLIILVPYYVLAIQITSSFLNYLFFLIGTIFIILKGFFLTELSFVDKKYLKTQTIMPIVYMGILTFFISGSFNIAQNKIEIIEDYILIQKIQQNEAAINTIFLSLLLTFLSFIIHSYFTKYYFQEINNEL